MSGGGICCGVSRAFDKRSGGALSSVAGDQGVGGGALERCRVGWLSLCWKLVAAVHLGGQGKVGHCNGASVGNLVVLRARAEPFSCPD
eukprot:908605-Ditylum_brightwellii.AAC.2